jgi:hypothetical protein
MLNLISQNPAFIPAKELTSDQKLLPNFVSIRGYSFIMPDFIGTLIYYYMYRDVHQLTPTGALGHQF